MEPRKQQFFGFVIILLIIGFLNYFRKLSNGLKLTKIGKILYISTMVTFISGIMFVLYYTEINNILSFIIGLAVANLSEHIAKLFVSLGSNFNIIIAKIIKKLTGIDISTEICAEDKDINSDKKQSNK